VSEFEDGSAGAMERGNLLRIVKGVEVREKESKRTAR